MIDLSHGEFRALVAKAFRGVGYSWGLTEEAAFSAGRLAEAGIDAAGQVLRLLNVVDGQPLAGFMPTTGWQGSGGLLCPICVGTSLGDQNGCDELQLGQTVAPLLIGPFLSTTLANKQSAGVDGSAGYTMVWDGARCVISAEALAFTGDPSPAPESVLITKGPVSVEAGPGAGRVGLHEETFDELERFAHRVYAPATDASRNAGAGAGTTDND